MSYVKKLILILSCAMISLANVIISQPSNSNYKFVESTVEKDYDEYGNPIFRTVYKELDPLVSLTDNFINLKAKLAKDQKSVFDDAKEKINEFKYYRDNDLRLFQGRIDTLKNKITSDMNDLEEQRSTIEENIATIKDEINDEDVDAEENMKITEQEYRSKLDDLKERKFHLLSLMTQHCDNCAEILQKYQIDVNLAKVDKDISELEQKFLKQAEEEEKILKELDAGKAAELNIKFSKLVSVLKNELDEYKKKEGIEELKDNIANEWKEYSENIENVQNYVRSKIENLTESSLYFENILNNFEDFSSSEESTQNKFKWIQYDEMISKLPKNAVSDCKDVDNIPLYVIRYKKGEDYIYGKYAFGPNRMHAYVTDNVKEFGVFKFDVSLLIKNIAEPLN